MVDFLLMAKNGPGFRFYNLLLIAVLPGFSSVQTQYQPITEPLTVQVNFFSEVLHCSYSSDLLSIKPSSVLDDNNIRNFYSNLEKSDYEILLQDLLEKKDQYRLNDWFYYQLMRSVLEKIYRTTHSSPTLELALWFFMTKSGFDTRITYLKNEVFLNVKTAESFYSIPYIKEEDTSFVNLSGAGAKAPAKKEFYLLEFVPNPGGRFFSFKLGQWPAFPANLVKKELHFTYRDTLHTLELTIDKNIPEWMNTYPLIGENEYFLAPMSIYAKKSLHETFLQLLKNRPVKESLEILVSFTRAAFQYKEDDDYFGKNKPMVCEEVLFYPVSDCEDRSALFFNLVKDYLNLPMIILAFPDHITVAVALDFPIGPAIKHLGKNYYVCDPTGPSNSYTIGSFPKNYETRSFQVIGVYP